MDEAGPCWAVSGPGKGDYAKKKTLEDLGVSQLLPWASYSSHTLIHPEGPRLVCLERHYPRAQPYQGD